MLRDADGSVGHGASDSHGRETARRPAGMDVDDVWSEGSQRPGVTYDRCGLVQPPAPAIGIQADYQGAVCRKTARHFVQRGVERHEDQDVHPSQDIFGCEVDSMRFHASGRSRLKHERDSMYAPNLCHVGPSAVPQVRSSG